MGNVQSHGQLINGVLTNFTGTYRDINNRQAAAPLSMVCDTTGVQMDNRKKDFTFRRAAPHFHLWERHDQIVREGMDSETWQVEAFKWGVKLQWPREDREDDQTGSLVGDAQAAGRSAALHNERMFFDAWEGTTNILPYALKAPDGLDPFSTTTRFETSGGNVQSGESLATAVGWQSAVFAARERFGNFKDGKGQPLLTPDIIDGPMVIVCNNDVAEFAFQAFRQERNIGTHATTQTTNLFQDMNRNITIWDTQRQTTTQAWIFLTGGPVPPCFVANRTPLETLTSMGGDSRSDETADFDIEWVQWRFRSGFGINEPYAAIQITA